MRTTVDNEFTRRLVKGKGRISIYCLLLEWHIIAGDVISALSFLSSI
jgi:hypothetical protein